MARELRKHPTESERVLWEQLRKHRLGNYRFVRQKPFVYEKNQKESYFFIADFYCAEKKLVIELDGKLHQYQKYYDYQRGLVLKELGLNTLRIKNEELENLDVVKAKILECLKIS